MAPDTNNSTQVPIKQSEDKTLTLPLQIISQGDISRLTREVESLEEFFAQASIQAANAKTLPQASSMLTLINEENGLNILQKEDRLKIKQFLELIHTKAPIVHASFATEPKPDFLMKLTAWFRAEAHPYVLLETGLQPNIAAGCIFRTTNKYFDFSFREHFKASKAKLTASMRSPQ